MWELATIIGIAGITIFLAVLSFKLDESKPLKIFFFILTFFFLVLGMAITFNIASSNSAPESIVNLLRVGFIVVLWFAFLVFAYIFLMFLRDVLLNIQIKKEKRRNGIWERW